MTKKKNMTKGERFETLEVKVAQLETAQRFIQMLLQQIGNSMQPLSNDIKELANQQRELQYKVLAIRELGGWSVESIDTLSESLQIKDFTDLSDKEDLEKNYTITDVVAEDSCVILTTTVPADQEAKGFLRSKVLVSEIGIPELRTALIGKVVGDCFDCVIGTVNHSITLLGIRKVPAPPAVEATEPPTLSVVE